MDGHNRVPEDNQTGFFAYQFGCFQFHGGAHYRLIWEVFSCRRKTVINFSTVCSSSCCSLKIDQMASALVYISFSLDIDGHNRVAEDDQTGFFAIPLWLFLVTRR